MSGKLWRLQLPEQPVRGAYVSLGEEWPALVKARGYSEDAAALLGQALLAMPLLMVHLKTRAKLSLQISQAGPLKLLAVQGSTQGNVRGMIKLDGESLNLAELQGQLAVTLEPEHSDQRFQGIVPLDGDGMSIWLQHYFEQSEQVPTRLLLRADQTQAAGFMLQAMPGEEAELDWMQAVDQLDVSYLPAEPGEWLSTMLGLDISMAEEATPVDLGCQCTQDSVGQMLLKLGRDEVNSILEEQELVSVECGFCGETYHFDEAKVQRLFADELPAPKPN